MLSKALGLIDMTLNWTVARTAALTAGMVSSFKSYKKFSYRK